ncbi:hypothetical protein SBA4_3800009 [Candidatus Sulfopaludibacter sp. SbA4]|nr:hypothetical protein SBA4_3800009 [Candidatus Sulfopaludibacter sp. SbA4]
MTPDPQPLTKQDLREALDAALQPLITRLDALATKQDALAAKQDATDAHLDAAVQTLTTKQEAIIDAFAHNLTDLRHELTQQFEILQTRTERTDINLSGLLIQIGGMSKSLTALERSNSQTTTTQAAQQRAIDDLYAQLAEIKRRLLPPQ